MLETKLKDTFIKNVRVIGVQRMRIVIRNLKKRPGNNMLKQSNSLLNYLDIFEKSKFYKGLTVDNCRSQLTMALTGDKVESVEEEVVRVESKEEDEEDDEEEIEQEEEYTFCEQDSGAEISDEEECESVDVELLKQRNDYLEAVVKRLRKKIDILESNLSELYMTV